MSTDKTEREAFEAWATSYSTFSLERDGVDYESIEQTMLWHAWQAAKGKAPEGASQGESHANARPGLAAPDSACHHAFALDPRSSIRICDRCGMSEVAARAHARGIEADARRAGADSPVPVRHAHRPDEGSPMSSTTPLPELPVLAWSYVPSDVWASIVLTADEDQARLAAQYGREVTALTDHAVASQEIASLREKLAAAEAQVGELRLERDTEQAMRKTWRVRAEAAEADAKRYRFLRSERLGLLLGSFDTTDTSDVGLDAAIDAHLERGEG